MPCRVADLADEPLFRKRAQGIIASHAQGIVDSVNDLRDLGLVASASAEVHTCGEPVRFKFYVLNEGEVFFGFYAVSEHTVALDSGPLTMFDLMGKDTDLLYFAGSDSDGDSTGRQFVEQSQAWFDTMWDTVSRVNN
jgi:hypothetical protein